MARKGSLKLSCWHLLKHTHTDTCRLCQTGLRLQGSYVIARLKPSLIDLAEELRAIVVLPDPSTGEDMPGDDKSTLHRHTTRAGAHAMCVGASF